MKDEVIYFDSFGVEHIPKEIKEFIDNKNIKAYIYCVEANDSVICGYFCIGFIDFMRAEKTLTIILLCFLLMILIGTIK